MVVSCGKKCCVFLFVGGFFVVVLFGFFFLSTRLFWDSLGVFMSSKMFRKKEKKK